MMGLITGPICYVHVLDSFESKWAHRDFLIPPGITSSLRLRRSVTESEMQEKEQNGSCEIVSVEGELNEKEENLLEFLDSLDDYLTLFGSVSSTLRQVKNWSCLLPIQLDSICENLKLEEFIVGFLFDVVSIVLFI